MPPLFLIFDNLYTLVNTTAGHNRFTDSSSIHRRFITYSKVGKRRL